MTLDVAETVLGFFGFDRTAYSNIKKGRRKWFEEFREQSEGHRNRDDLMLRLSSLVQIPRLKYYNNNNI